MPINVFLRGLEITQLEENGKNQGNYIDEICKNFDIDKALIHTEYERFQLQIKEYDELFVTKEREYTEIMNMYQNDIQTLQENKEEDLETIKKQDLRLKKTISKSNQV